ncbi:hypothetical protein [Kribbella sp. CA-294648]|uniref:hypothetical protein n=1 Tax=Kribbella sp. CA-294648 TaxID=3239948 RepID=UPI003D92CE85
MRDPLVISLYAVWPLAVVVAKLASGVRIRFLLVSTLTWVLALAIGTTATPPDHAQPVGLIIGASCCLFLAFAVSNGVTFTWSQHKTYFRQEGEVPRAEHVVLGVVALVDAAAVLLAVVG